LAEKPSLAELRARSERPKLDSSVEERYFELGRLLYLPAFDLLDERSLKPARQLIL